MNDINTLSVRGERLSFFKLYSEKKYSVEIPIIQRDYAQGRDSSLEVRTSFLDALYRYLDEGKPNRDLDFVYGTLLSDENSQRFIPLDGQQRLTTLFLLHWYLAKLSNKTEFLKKLLYSEGKSLFRYETRTSSSEFCDALMDQNIDLSKLLKEGVENTESVSKTIQECGWFHLSWMNDPTIKSMLTMLDSIHAKFFGSLGFFELLVDEFDPVITFLFLDLKEFKLTDDLYIKMNARGKPLTEFENFKAKFEQCVQELRGELQSTHELYFDGKKKEVDGYDYFVQKIDTDWADLFWGYRNQSTKDNSFDDELMNFIRLIVANHYLLDVDEKLDPQAVRLEKLFVDGARLRSLSFLEYEKRGCLSKEFVACFIQMMDVLHNNGIVGGHIKPYLADDDYYSEKDVFVKIIKNDADYKYKLRFHAFYSYLLAGKAVDDLPVWMRVVYNLTENFIFNRQQNYAEALSQIDTLCKNQENILYLLKQNVGISGFNDAQVLEEKIKAHLITKSMEWETQVVALEKHSYFDGQIGFVLSFSGILDFYNNKKNCEWSESENEKYIAAFKYYADCGSKVFTLIEKSSKLIGYSWERAVLSKGMYFVDTTAFRLNMLSTRLVKNNIERDFSWKRLLRLAEDGEKKWKARQSYVKAVFDDPLFDANDIPNSLNQMCIKALSNPDIEDWRMMFIKEWKLFEQSKQGFIFKNEQSILLLQESQRNHYHSELYSKLFEINFTNTPINTSPFKSFKYQYVKSGDDLPCFILGEWVHNDSKYSLKVFYIVNTYELRFQDNKVHDYPSDVVNVLEGRGFERLDPDLYYVWRGNTASDAFDRLTALCEDFRELVNE